MMFRIFINILFFFSLIFAVSPVVKSDDLVEQLREDVLGRDQYNPSKNKRLADLLQGQGLKEEAVFYYRRASELNPESVPFKKELAQSLIKLERIEDGIEVYKEIFESDPGDEESAVVLANLLEGAGRVEESEAVYWELISATRDVPSRLRVATRMAELAQNHRRIEVLLDSVSGQSVFSTSGERALFLSQVYASLNKISEAQQVLERELTAEESAGKEPDLFLLNRLIEMTRLTGDLDANLRYNKRRALLCPSPENLSELERAGLEYRKSFRAKEEYYRGNPGEFLDDLSQFLTDPKTKNEAVSFSIDFLPDISSEQIAGSLDGIVVLFRDILFSRQENWTLAADLWKRIRLSIRAVPEFKSPLAEFYRTLIGVPPELGKTFSREETEDFQTLLELGTVWEGYWTANGWTSLFGTMLDSVSDPEPFFSELSRIDSARVAKEDIKRADILLMFRQEKFFQARVMIQEADFLDTPHPRALSADWTLFHEMKRDPDSSTQEFLAEAYRKRIPLTAGSPDERFVLSQFRRAALASGNDEMIAMAAAPLIENLEKNFVLACQSDPTGISTHTDPNTGETHQVSIYEILNELLDTATELKAMGLSKETTAMYHRYGEGKDWWAKNEGQGVFFFEELKKIVEETE